MADESNGTSATVTSETAEVTLTEEQRNEIARLKAEEQLANTQQKTIEAKKGVVDAQQLLAASELDLLTAKLPDSTVTTPTGDVSVDEAGYMAELIAYQAMQRCATETANRINTKLANDAEILIVDKFDFAPGDYPRLLIQSQFELYEKSFQGQLDRINALPAADAKDAEGKLIPELALAPVIGAAFTALSVAPQVLGAAAGVLSYFKTDYASKKRDVTLEDSAFKAAVAGKINDINVRILDFHLVTDSRILIQYVSLLEQRFTLENSKIVLSDKVVIGHSGKIEEFNAQLAKLKEAKKPEERTEDEKKQLENLEGAIARATSAKGDAEQVAAETDLLLKKFDDFITLVTTKTGDDQPLLLQAAMRDHILEVGTTHLLYVKIESKGGEAMTKKTLWTKGGDTAFLGGVAASYILVDVTGAVVSADTISAASELHRKIGGGQDSPVKNIEIPLT